MINPSGATRRWGGFVATMSLHQGTLRPTAALKPAAVLHWHCWQASVSPFSQNRLPHHPRATYGTNQAEADKFCTLCTILLCPPVTFAAQGRVAHISPSFLPQELLPIPAYARAWQCAGFVPRLSWVLLETVWGQGPWDCGRKSGGLGGGKAPVAAQLFGELSVEQLEDWSWGGLLAGHPVCLKCLIWKVSGVCLEEWLHHLQHHKSLESLWKVLEGYQSLVNHMRVPGHQIVLQAYMGAREWCIGLRKEYMGASKGQLSLEGCMGALE